MAKRVRSNGKKRWTLERVVHVLMQEIADTRLELKGDMADMKRELKADIHALDQKLTAKIEHVDKKLTARIDNLNFKVDQNHIAFMTNQQELEGRVAVLEKR